MKKIFFAPIMLVCSMVLTSTISYACPPSGDKADTHEERSDAGDEAGTFRFVSLDMSVSDMTCMGCENKVKAALGQIEGIVETNSVDAETDIASISFDPELTSQDKIVAELAEKTGYKVAILKSAAMDAASDVDGVKKPCSAECQKACCADGKGKKQCTAEQKAACDKAKVQDLDDEMIQAE